MIKIMKKMNRWEVSLLLCNAMLVLAQVWMDMRIPDYMSTITRLVETEGSDMNEIWIAGFKMLACAIASMFITFGSGFVSSYFAATFSKNLRSKIFDKVQSFSLEEIDRFSTASLITRSTLDVQMMQMFMTRGISMIIRSPISVGIALFKIKGKQWEWSALTGGAVFCVILAVIYVIKYAHPRFRRMQFLHDDMNRVMRDNMTGIRVVRAYNAEEYQEGKFYDANDRLTQNGLEAMHAMGIMHPTMRFTNNGLTVGIYFLGALIINRSAVYADRLTVFSDMVVFANYASRILFAFMSLNMIFNTIPRASVCAERINEILETDATILDGKETEGVEGKEGEIEFRNVSFRYPGTEGDVLTDISFTAKKGETVAFIGATGSGKTTLVNLIPRLYDCTGGEVIVAGRNVKEYTQKSLRNMIGYATQQAVLFTGTVSSNVSYGEGKPIEGRDEESDIKAAVAIAQATDFVEEMEGGYDADINRGGTNVSGGQKQRLSVARAVYRKPDIYIFDDTFSALDYKTDRALRNRLKKETADVTTLIVAQRVGTIRDADKILVLDDGKIVGMGTHEQLLRDCEVYKEIARTQLSEEELA